METANELLQQILGVVTQINNTISHPTQDSAPTGGSGGTGAGVSIAGMLSSFGKTKEKDRKVFKEFMTDMSDIAKISGDGGKNIKALSAGIISLSVALPDLAQGLDELGSIKHKRVNRAVGVLERLFQFMDDSGDSSSFRNINRAISTFDKMGDGLMKIAKPLKMMSNFLLHFGISILAFSGAIALSAVVLGVGNPLGALGFIGATVLLFTGAAALLSLAAPFIQPGLDVVKDIGKGLMWMAGGILAFAITMNLVGTLMGVGSGADGMYDSLKVIGLIVAASVGMFALMGLAKPLVEKGVMVAGGMALGMAFLSLGVLAVALSSRALAGIAGYGQDLPTTEFMGMEVSPFIAGLGTFGLVVVGSAALFALMGLAAPAIIPGAAAALLVSGAMIALALSVRETSKIAAGMDGKDVADNLTTLISATFIGLRDGVGQGLLGEQGGGKSWWQKAGIVAKNTAQIMGGIALLGSVSVALSLFALSLRAFQSVGQIRPIIGHNADGHPIYGTPVTVSQVAFNVADSINVFFSTLGEMFGEEGSAIPSQKTINAIVTALMGEGGLRVFGFDVARTKPNLMDALYKFGDVLTFWGKFGAKNEIPMGTDKDGKPIKPVKVNTVAKNIASTLKTFMEGLSEAVIKVNDELAEKTGLMAQILLGEGAFKVFGLSFGRDKPGILEPIAKFADIIKQFADGKYVSEYVNGEPVYKSIDYGTTAKKITRAISSFTTVLSSEMEKLTKMDNFKGAGSKASDYLEKFEDMFESLGELAETTSGLDRLGNSLMEVGEGIGLIGENLDKVDTAKLETAAAVSANYMKQTDGYEGSNARVRRGSGFSSGTPTSVSESKEPDWDRVAQVIGAQVGEQVAAAFKSGMMKFEFSPTGNNSGIISFE